VVKRMGIALIVGLGISAILLWISYSTKNELLVWLQLPGLLVCMILRGVHSATKADYVEIAILINAAIYAVFIFLLLRPSRAVGSN
jgi:hypothetical protein